MSAIKNLILDIELSYKQGLNKYEIAKKFNVDIKLIDDAIHVLNCEGDYLLQNNPAKY
jgi:transposase